MGSAMGNDLTIDAMNFVRTLELSGYNFRHDKDQEKVKEYVASLASQQNIQVYLAECSSKEYRVNCMEYFTKKEDRQGQKIDRELLNDV